jgi:hypothetical protein
LPPPCFPFPSAGTAEVGYAVVQRRRRARSPDVTFSTSASAPVYDLDGIAVSLSNTNRFGWIAVRVLVQRKSMELPTRIVVGCYKKGGSSAQIAIRSISDEASNVDTEFNAGRSAEFAGGRRSTEFDGGRRTAVDLSNIPLTPVLSYFFCPLFLCVPSNMEFRRRHRVQRSFYVCELSESSKCERDLREKGRQLPAHHIEWPTRTERHTRLSAPS